LVDWWNHWAVAAHQEIEVKLEVPPDAVLPDLAVLPGVAAVEAPREFTLESVYLDTPDLRLARARMTLRRRTGGPDEGWHLKLQVSPDERTEFRAPLGSGGDGQVPAELAAAVRARVREAPLAPVVVLNTRRTVHRVLDVGGRVLAEVADDTVTSRFPEAEDEVADAWREWEVELVEGDRDLLQPAVKLLRGAGGAVPGWPSKLARALGDRLTAANADADEDRGRVKVGSAGAVLGDHLRTQRDALLARDPQARRDEPDAVHQMRVATRQLRSTLATFRPLLAREASEVVRVELGWLGEALGAARDAEVMRDLLAVHLTQAPAGLVGDVVTQRLDADRTQALTAARELLTQALDSARYFRLLDALDALVDAPPWTKAAARTAARALPPLVRRDWKRLARAYDAARQSAPGPRREALLHETRKAAKRARYAAEATVPVVGRPAAKFARAAKDLQTLLGDHHDCVVLRDLLAQMGAQADVEGKNAFIYGRLYALEQARAEHLETQLPAAWKRVSAKRRRRWLA